MSRIPALVLFAVAVALSGCKSVDKTPPPAIVVPHKAPAKVAPVGESVDKLDKPLNQAGKSGVLLEQSNRDLKNIAAGWELEAKKATGQALLAKKEVERLTAEGKTVKKDVSLLEQILDDIHTRNAVLEQESAKATAALNEQGKVIVDLNAALDDSKVQLNGVRRHAAEKESQLAQTELLRSTAEAEKALLSSQNGQLHIDKNEAVRKLSVSEGKVKELASYKTFFYVAAGVVILLVIVALYLKFAKPI